MPYLNELTGIDLKIEEYVSVDWNDTYGPEFSEMYKAFDTEHTDIYLEAKLVDDSLYVIEKLLENEDKIYFVTARQKSIEHITLKWLDKVGLGKIKVYSLDGNESKVPMAKKLKCQYFIEDDPNNAKNLIKAGIEVILMDTNYNKSVIGSKLHRVKNWKEIQNILL
ncbi:5' nucleotidase, NT5C type [Peptostreptococcus equinus]|uniref:Nucleotidase n=1 Tax=Peptostreptococcus equinus TaxID=3003601 RepID=A0ABY7JM97_9FIRM|nr:haloacid dehalogenase-like hydrolase [Peptostreptococcus sp. CBA3647]WAW14457.1 haloacid dehalogenase-like hydrolase [Peptostreptococcus sp. CBA3647]